MLSSLALTFHFFHCVGKSGLELEVELDQRCRPAESITRALDSARQQGKAPSSTPHGEKWLLVETVDGKDLRQANWALAAMQSSLTAYQPKKACAIGSFVRLKDLGEDAD
ncbi:MULTISPECIES: hypothetical protein [Pseudomonas]|uniref:Uncharacterized protein n=1 Tax=Pseudomonas mercuritolerans TaxID=2951809 RepID=A0ABT2XSU1_9PSED|nr:MULTISPECIES: hypothetical protein [Pseudomonas]MCV2221779.1 hypothetical protein [Pseudomonas mercuritolerans]